MSASTPAKPQDGGGLSGLELFSALFIVVIWGLNFIAMKWGLETFTPFEMGALRYVFGALPMLLLVRPPRIGWRWVVGFGLFQGVAQFSFGFYALQLGMTAALASVLMQTQVFFTALLSFIALRERPSRPLVLGMALAAVGLVCFALNFLGPQTAGGATAIGIVLSLCAAASWAVSNLIAGLAQRAAPGYDPIAFVVWSCPGPLLAFIALTALTQDGAARWLQADAWRAIPLVGWGAVAYLGWAATVMAHGLWTRLLTRHPANRVAPFSLGVPVVGLAAGMLVLGEVVTPWQWAGTVFIVSALACVVLGGRWAQRR